MFLQGKRFGIVYVGRKLRSIEYENGRKVTYKVPLNEVGIKCNISRNNSSLFFKVFTFVFF